MTNHREHTCYFQKVGTKREKRETTGTIRAINSYSYLKSFVQFDPSTNPQPL
ncbi:hypothetical protein HanIR_Chr11g0531351 [Helianthus annuus]|nr:hypothetical protein HanIR_Chr11g0531351 [Helianthus annuus]